MRRLRVAASAVTPKPTNRPAAAKPIATSPC